jgi:hypothetical protein
MAPFQEVRRAILDWKSQGKQPYEISALLTGQFWISLSPSEIIQMLDDDSKDEAMFTAARQRYERQMNHKALSLSEYAQIERGIENGYVAIMAHWLNIAEQLCELGHSQEALKQIRWLKTLNGYRLIGLKKVPNAMLYAYMRAMRSMEEIGSSASVAQAMGRDQERRDIHRAICHWVAESPGSDWGALLTQTVEAMWKEEAQARFQNQLER